MVDIWIDGVNEMEMKLMSTSLGSDVLLRNDKNDYED